MEAAYYPGCSLHGMAAEYNESIHVVCDALGVRLRELPDWSCCGASSAHTASNSLAVNLASRNLDLLREEDRQLLVPCASCFNRLKFAQKDRAAQPGAVEGGDRTVDILNLSAFFDQPLLHDRIKGNLKRPLSGIKAVPYYGCLTQRPAHITDAKTPENPVSMDRILKLIGAQVMPWSYKTDCCGGSLTLVRPDLVRSLSWKLFAGAREAGAECIVTDCPMCQSNLDTRERDIELEQKARLDMPILYVTELLALAFDRHNPKWWRKHMVDPTALLARKGLLGNKG
jgi:heterodisulfide reductase subunit B2